MRLGMKAAAPLVADGERHQLTPQSTAAVAPAEARGYHDIVDIVVVVVR
jgi:hypothetical protein